MNTNYITVNCRAKALADAALLLYWHPGDTHFQTTYDEAVLSLGETIADMESEK